MKRIVLIPVGACALFALTGCGGGKERHDVTEKYILVVANKKLSYWQSAAAGLMDAAKQMGVQAEVAGPDTYEPKEEVEAFARTVDKNPSGILVSAADAKMLQASIDSAVAKGIPVITMDSDSPGSKRLTFVGTNNYLAGQMGGRVAAKALGGKGNVVVYTMPGQTNLEERLDGYKTVFAQNPGIKIVETVDVHGDPRIAFDRTKEILQQGKLKPDGFVCLEATACAEVAEVLSREKATGKVVVAMDAAPETLEGIQKGLINATIAQKPYSMAFYGLKVLDDLYHYKPAKLDADGAMDSKAHLPNFIDTGAQLVDKGNVDAFLKAITPAQ
ncbi:MAG: substrate-binding domain-containing protein [Bryobacteraceae bacterium]